MQSKRKRRIYSKILANPARDVRQALMTGSFGQGDFALPHQHRRQQTGEIGVQLFGRVEHVGIFGAAACVGQLRRVKGFQNQLAARSQALRQAAVGSLPNGAGQMGVNQHHRIQAGSARRPVIQVGQLGCQRNATADSRFAGF